MARPASFSGWLLEAGRRLPVQMNDYPRQNPAYRLTYPPAARLDCCVGFSGRTLTHCLCARASAVKSALHSSRSRRRVPSLRRDKRVAARLDCGVGFEPLATVGCRGPGEALPGFASQVLCRRKYESVIVFPEWQKCTRNMVKNSPPAPRFLCKTAQNSP